MISVSFSVAPWWRSVIGAVAGGMQAWAGGLNWKAVLAGIGITALGVITHLSSPNPSTLPNSINVGKPIH